MAVNKGLLAVQIGGMAVVFGLILFVSAGTIAWVWGWAFLVLFFTFVIAISLWLLKNSPGLLTERMKGTSQAEQKGWDKFFFAVTYLLFIGWMILMPVDAVRLHWSNMPVWLQVAGGLVLVGSFFLFSAVFKVNSFLSPVARVQDERGQTVISSGPYGVVRHPMYAAFVLFALGTTFLLGSWYGSPIGLLMVVGVSWRAVQEEKMMRAELPGYEDYMAQVKYRLIPFVW